MSAASQTVHASANTAWGPVGLPAYRFYRSEVALIFARRRNQAGLVGLACVPVIMAAAVKMTDTESGGGFIGSIASNGMFVVLAALVASLPLFLPVAVAAIAGDSVAGEANTGTLRYLLTVPVGRTKLLAIKFAAIVTFCAACTTVITLSGLMIGWALFPIGDVTLLSGTTISQLDGIGRLLLVCAYITVCLSALGALGLFVSTMTEQPVGAMIAVLVITVLTGILHAIPQLDALHPYLFVHYWTAFADLMRDPIAWGGLRDGALVALAYIAVFGSAAWARFSAKDISS